MRSLAQWSGQFYHKKTKIFRLFQDRPPLFIFAGDVGTGKTGLAETFGNALARESGLSVTLYTLSLNARGTGAVGEMTNLLSIAFAEVRQAARRASGRGGKHSSPKEMRLMATQFSGAYPSALPPPAPAHSALPPP